MRFQGLFRIMFSAAVSIGLAASAKAAPFVYVVTGSQQFGTVDLANGSFHAIGNPMAALMTDLVWDDGTLYSLVTGGNDFGALAKVNIKTGEVTEIGPTGLGFNAFSLAAVRGKLYLTDVNGNLYTVNRETGEATPAGSTGMPPDTYVPFTFNNDGTFNLCDQAFYGIDGELYATLDAFALDLGPTVPTIAHVFISPALYRIDPESGAASYVAPIDLQVLAMVEAEGKTYAFHGVLDGFDRTYDFPIAHSEVMRFDVKSGKLTKLTEVDPSAGPIFGAAPVRGRVR